MGRRRSGRERGVGGTDAPLWLIGHRASDRDPRRSRHTCLRAARPRPIRETFTTGKRTGAPDSPLRQRIRENDPPVSHADAPGSLIDHPIIEKDGPVSRTGAPGSLIDPRIIEKDGPVSRTGAPVPLIDPRITEKDDRVSRTDAPVSLMGDRIDLASAYSGIAGDGSSLKR